MNKTAPNENSFDFILLSIQNSIASPELNKCLLEDDEVAFTQCWCKTLQHLVDAHQTNAFVRFFQSTITSFHSKNKCSCKTLIFLSILLWKQLKWNIVQNELSSKKITDCLSHLIDQIVDSVKRSKTISLILSSQLNVKSRHLCKTINYTSIKAILNGVCRNDVTIANLIWNLLEEHMNLSVDFDYENILIETSSHKSQFVINSIENDSIETFNYKIARGLLIHLDESNYKILNELKNIKYLNSITVDGSLECDYQFLGFNKNLNYSQFYSPDSDQITSKLVWQHQMKDILIQNNIKVLFVRGKIDKDLQNFCLVNSIVVCSNLSNRLFKHIISECNCVPITYLEHLDSINVFKIELKLAQFLNDYYLNLSESSLFTVLIQTRLKSTLNLYKEKTIHCLKRVHNIVVNSRYLIGNGTIEKYVFDELDKLKVNDNNDLVYYNVTRECLSNAFKTFYSTITANSKSSSDTYDDFESKTEAWKIACLLNKYLLSVDLAIQI